MRLIALVLAGVVLVAGCGGGKAPSEIRSTKPAANVAACEAAMRAQFKKAMDDPNAPSGTRPPECDGIDDKTLEQLAGKIMSDAFATESP